MARKDSLADYGRAAKSLGQTGADIAALAAAIEVIVRRAERPEVPLD